MQLGWPPMQPRRAEQEVLLLKVDVEGHEVAVLDGARAALRAGRVHAILLEWVSRARPLPLGLRPRPRCRPHPRAYLRSHPSPHPSPNPHARATPYTRYGDKMDPRIYDAMKAPYAAHAAAPRPQSLRGLHWLRGYADEYGCAAKRKLTMYYLLAMSLPCTWHAHN